MHKTEERSKLTKRRPSGTSQNEFDEFQDAVLIDVDECHRNYLFCIFTMIAIQYIMALLCIYGLRLSETKEMITPEVTVVLILLFATVFISLCIKKVNDINRPSRYVLAAFMQFLFTLLLALSLAFAYNSFEWWFIEPMCILIVIWAISLCLVYYFTRCDPLTRSGLSTCFFIQMIISAIMMNANSELITSVQYAFHSSMLLIIYLSYGILKATTQCHFQIRYSIRNVFAGVSLVYTFFIIPINYQKLKN